MKDFDKSPLDLDGDGDDAVEMCLFFDEDEKNKQGGSKPPSNSGCCVMFLAVGVSIGATVWGITHFLA